MAMAAAHAVYTWLWELEKKANPARNSSHGPRGHHSIPYCTSYSDGTQLYVLCLLKCRIIELALLCSLWLRLAHGPRLGSKTSERWELA